MQADDQHETVKIIPFYQGTSVDRLLTHNVTEVRLKKERKNLNNRRRGVL